MFASITVLAPGLLGGSVAQAARRRALAPRLRVWARRAEAREELRRLPWCDDVADTPEAAVSDAALVVICAPVDRIAPLVAQIAAALPTGAVVTDVGSVKTTIARQSTAALGNRAHFVGAHPMAGSERTGHANSHPDLFRGRPCFVTPLPETDARAVQRVADFWRALDAEVVIETPERHDEIVAHLSHLPHVLASSLCSFLARRDPRWRDLAGPGLRDATRIASGDAGLWRGILEQNRDEVLRALEGFQSEAEAMRLALTRRDFAAVQEILERGRAFRDGWRA